MFFIYIESRHNFGQQKQQTHNLCLNLFSYFSILVALHYFLNQKKSSLLHAEELSISGDEKLSSKENKPLEDIVPGLEIEGLPFYSLEQVSKHNDPNNLELGVWIIYKAGILYKRYLS